MDNRYEIAEQNGMSRDFADWFFDNKKAGCGNVWFMMMAAMWEGWQRRAAMLQGADGNSPAIPDGWVMVPVEPTIAILDEFDSIIDYGAEDSKDAWSRLLAAAWIKSLPAAPQREVK
ncbi:TPA: hypothetical protein ACWOSY_000397 [Enterobacter cloacae]|uniref:hypothetical protein n=1 Tax=Enterobacter cloacae TaxID=550 RepID=UPI00398547FC